MGFNICMVSRNEEKMQEKIKAITAACGNKQIQTRIIVADFFKMSKISEFQSQIADKV